MQADGQIDGQTGRWAGGQVGNQLQRQDGTWTYGRTSWQVGYNAKIKCVIGGQVSC